MTHLDMQPTIDGTSTDPVTRCLMLARNKLKEPGTTSFYLGNTTSALGHRVIWKRVGCRNRLVTKESAEAVEKAQQAQAATEGNASNSADTPHKDDTEALLDPAILSVIVLIDFDDCWLTPCGYWKGPTKVTQKFEDLKLSFQGKAPTKDFLTKDFVAAVGNVKALMDIIALGGAKSKGLLNVSKTGGDALRFRHVVFERIEETANNGSDTASESEDAWTMSDWPVVYDEAAAERDRLASTHRPVPLPAYDVNGDLIAPERCKQALAGAIARVTFTLNHWFIDKSTKEETSATSATNTFVADVQSIRILVEPPSQAMTPKKRKTARRDPGEGSPSKRSHKY